MKVKITCPKCGSTDVKLNITASAAVGAPQMYICNKCGYQNYLFPQIGKTNEKEETEE